MVSVGVPVGLGIHLASAGRRHRSVGVAASVGGALGGAWLGFHTADGALGLATTVAGAIAAASLLLLALDIARDRTAVRDEQPVKVPAPVG